MPGIESNPARGSRGPRNRDGPKYGRSVFRAVFNERNGEEVLRGIAGDPPPLLENKIHASKKNFNP